MDDFLKMDVFFVVSTVAVLVVTALLAFVLVRVLRILGRVEQISEVVSEEAQLVRKDVADLRENVRTEGFKLKHLANFASSTFGRYRPTGKK
jgi:hypothetical protein